MRLSLLAIVLIVGAFYLAWPKSRCDRKTFSMIHMGMSETEVLQLLGEPGWHAGFGHTYVKVL
jgi:hypothetical protein